MKVSVIGASIAGLSAAWQLVRRGHGVTVLDQGPIPNPGSASSDQHRMIRPQYGPQAEYSRMLRAAFATWDEMWADLGAAHFAATGVLAIDLGDTEWMQQTVLASRGGDAARALAAPPHSGARALPGAAARRMGRLRAGCRPSLFRHCQISIIAPLVAVEAGVVLAVMRRVRSIFPQ